MIYKYVPDSNFEDFSSGRVLYHKANFPNFPVRLAAEIFYRCVNHSSKKDNICLYDPCCGSSYILSVLGFLCNDVVKTMYASDISQEAVDLSVKNLSLLSSSGIASRKNELQDLFSTYHKESHKDALDSIDRLTKKLKHEVKSHVFVEDILRKDALHDETFTADVLITDVPYNNLVNWSSNNGNEINELLDAIIPVIDPNTIIAIVHNKKQKLNNPRYKVLEKLSVGHRKIEIIQLHG